MAFALPMSMVEDFEVRLERTWWAKSWAKRRDALAMGLGLCGLRACEVLGSRWSDLLPADESLRVRTAKGGRPRIVRVGMSWIEAYRKVRGERVPEGDCRRLLFYTSRQQALAYEELRRRCNEWTLLTFGRSYSFHCLRHTAAMRMYEATRDVKAVQEFLGHKNLQSTSVYLTSLRVHDFTPGLPSFVEGKQEKRLRLFDPDGESTGPAVVDRVEAVAGGRRSTDAGGDGRSTAERMAADVAADALYSGACGSVVVGGRKASVREKKKAVTVAEKRFARMSQCEHEYKDELLRDRRIRTTCARCGHLLGYRPAGVR